MSDTHTEKDETTRIDYDKLLKNLNIGIMLSGITPLGFLPLIYQVLKASQKSKPTPTENLKEIIKAGKEQGLSELEVEMDKSTAAGIDFGIFSDFGGVSVNPEFEVKNRILLKVKYK